ncbi:MAG: hypothetical protein IKY66_03585 [Bacteroidales bacterium]|nr:hypothetical protein [Bacteroidales bacterium]
MKGKKTGGRQKGTPNKITSDTKEAIANLLNNYAISGDMEKDFKAIKSGKDRLYVAEKFAQYIIPKQQAITAEVGVDVHEQTIEDRLVELSKDPEE